MCTGVIHDILHMTYQPSSVYHMEPRGIYTTNVKTINDRNPTNSSSISVSGVLMAHNTHNYGESLQRATETENTEKETETAKHMQTARKIDSLILR